MKLYNLSLDKQFTFLVLNLLFAAKALTFQSHTGGLLNFISPRRTFKFSILSRLSNLN